MTRIVFYHGPLPSFPFFLSSLPIIPFCFPIAALYAVTLLSDLHTRSSASSRMHVGAITA
jgi:hypothetical protein